MPTTDAVKQANPGSEKSGITYLDERFHSAGLLGGPEHVEGKHGDRTLPDLFHVPVWDQPITVPRSANLPLSPCHASHYSLGNTVLLHVTFAPDTSHAFLHSGHAFLRRERFDRRGK